jgi:hypothetical protein
MRRVRPENHQMSKAALKAVEATETASPTSETASPDSPTQSITIGGLVFTAPAPYTEGHVLSAVEAKVLNTTLGENLRNNFAKQVKDAQAAGELGDEVLAKLHADFAAYAAGYAFASKRGGGTRTSADPVAKEAFRIAKDVVLRALRAKNIDIKTLPEGKLDGLVKGLLEKDSKYLEEAKRRIDATKQVVGDALEGLI